MAIKSLPALAVVSGTASASLSKWLLIWLFARSDGGAESVGLYSSMLALATPLFVVCQLGLRNIFVSSIVRLPWYNYLKLRIIGSAFGGVSLVVVILLVPGMPFDLGLVLCLLKMADSVLDIYLARLQYANHMMTLGVINTASGVVTMIGSVAVVAVSGDATYGVLVAAVISCGAALWARRAGGLVSYETSFEGNPTRNILRKSLPVTSFQLLASVLVQLPIVALTLIAEASTVGVYAGAAYLLTAAALIGATLETLLITPFRRLRERQGTAALKAYSTRIILYTIGGGVIAGIGVVCFGSEILQTVYGQGFAVGTWDLVNLAVAATATVGAYVASVTLTVLNRYEAITFATGSSCAISMLTGFTLVLSGVPALAVGTGMAAAGATARLILIWSLTRRSNAPRGD